MIPISTALYDPKWYHEFKDQSHYYFDKNDVINGLRYPPLNPNIDCECSKECPKYGHDPTKCHFIQDYYNAISKIDFDKMLNKFEAIANWIKQKNNIMDEMAIILIVHETPENQCSERSSLIRLFKEHDIELKEFEHA
jgi:hypothetical protein